jgi:hypothetical protein
LCDLSHANNLPSIPSRKRTDPKLGAFNHFIEEYDLTAQSTFKGFGVEWGRILIGTDWISFRIKDSRPPPRISILRRTTLSLTSAVALPEAIRRPLSSAVILAWSNVWWYRIRSSSEFAIHHLPDCAPRIQELKPAKQPHRDQKEDAVPKNQAKREGLLHRSFPARVRIV